MRTKPLSKSATLSENLELRVKLAEAANMLRAIRAGEADALLIESGHGPEVYTIEGREAETNRIRSEMLAQVSDAVIATDCEGRMTYLNAAAERLCELSGSSLLGRPYPIPSTCQTRIPWWLCSR